MRPRMRASASPCASSVRPVRPSVRPVRVPRVPCASPALPLRVRVRLGLRPRASPNATERHSASGPLPRASQRVPSRLLELPLPLHARIGEVQGSPVSPLSACAVTYKDVMTT